MSNEELNESMELILEALPEYHDPSDRRKHALTRKDAELIAAMIKVRVKSQQCTLGLDGELVASLRQMVKERKKILAIVGAAVLSVFGYVGKKTLEAIDWQWIDKLWHKLAG